MATQELLYYVWAALLLLASLAAWCLTIFTLPGNWIVVALAALFAWLVNGPEGQGIGWSTVLVLVLLAAVGELLEFGAGAVGAARRGGSRRAVVLSIVGALLGSIGGAVVGLPFLPLIGPAVAAILGGALGAFAGAYLGEEWKGRAYAERVEIGKGAFYGRLWGTVAKLAAGAIMVVVIGLDALFLG